MPYVVTSECIQCGACESGCESGAIEEGETQSHIDINVCIECGTCASNCPVEAIVFVDETADAGAPAPQQADEPRDTRWLAPLQGDEPSEAESPGDS